MGWHVRVEQELRRQGRGMNIPGRGTQALLWIGKWCEKATEKRSAWLVSTDEGEHGG